MKEEEYYIARDEFMAYIEEKVNPAREKAGLSAIRDHEAKECFRIIHEFREEWNTRHEESVCPEEQHEKDTD